MMRHFSPQYLHEVAKDTKQSVRRKDASEAGDRFSRTLNEPSGPSF